MRTRNYHLLKGHQTVPMIGASSMYHEVRFGHFQNEIFVQIDNDVKETSEIEKWGVRLRTVLNLHDQCRIPVGMKRLMTFLQNVLVDNSKLKCFVCEMMVQDSDKWLGKEGVSAYSL